MKSAASRLGLACLLVGCTAKQSSGDPPADISVFVRVQGSCSAARIIDAEGNAEEGAREVGDLGRYETPRWTPEERLRVRANARFSSGDHRNLIGTLEGPAWILTYGPVKDAQVSAGLAAVVAVEDDDGARCRGYVSETVLRRAPP
jgi:hypothetical protein